MKRALFFLAAALLAALPAAFFPACSFCSGSGQGASAPTEAPFVYVNETYPSELRCERNYLDPSWAKTSDLYTIDDMIAALEGLRVTGTTQASADDRTDVIRFVYDDGSVEEFVFEDGVWVNGGERFTVEGYENVVKVLDRMTERYGGYELPTRFTGTPYDDGEGNYWIFFGGGYGLGCGAFFKGFDGEWFTDGTLFTWGVLDGVLHVFPEGGDERQYPVSYGERTISLGELTLTETYTQELNSLYVQWTAVGKRIEAELGL